MADPTLPDDSDDEFELEAVDPEILEHSRRRTERQIRDTETRAARLEIYEQPEQSDPFTLDDFKAIRFSTRHLLIATALLAIAMAFYVRMGGGVILIVWLAALGAGWWWVTRKERAVEEARRRRLQEAADRLAAQKNDDGELIAAKVEPTVFEPDEVLPRKPALSFSFSIKQILGTMAVAAVLLTLARLMGPDQAALLLGAVAVVGLVIQILGVELPGIVVFGWWILLVLYLVMSVWAIFFAGGSGG